MKDISETEAKVLIAFLDESKNIFAREDICTRTSIARTTILRIFNDMMKLDYLEKTKISLRNKGRMNVFYRLTPEGRKIAKIVMINKSDVEIDNKKVWTSRYIEMMLEKKK